MSTYTATGITLLARKYGDSGRVVTFYTQQFGKVEAVARGIGKPGSKLAAALEPFTESRLFLAQGKGLDRLAQAEVLESHLALREDLARYAYGAYLLELTALTTEPGAVVTGLFEDLQAALGRLSAGDDPELIVWAFTLRLLTALGTAPDAAVCAQCAGPLSSEAVYVPALGGFACSHCGSIGGSGLRVSAAALGAWRSLTDLPFDRLRRLQLRPVVRTEISRALRAHVDYYVGDRLKSLRFLEQVTGQNR